MPKHEKFAILVEEDRRNFINAIAVVLRLITSTAIGGCVGVLLFAGANNPQWQLGRDAGLLFGLSLQIRIITKEWEDSE